ncbi:MAG: hypothetical protein HYW26_03675 [Candidatus Aenigmarchaeota archaeon]|nr:hypothetical protein [Candidatus Aenigmarchaeota archaeon]
MTELAGRFRNGVTNYAADLALILAALFIYRTYEYYVNFLRDDTQHVLLLLALAYAVFGLPYFLFFAPKEHKSKGIIIFGFLERTVKSRKFSLLKDEKVSLLFLVVKFFFLPIMINFAFGNFSAVLERSGSMFLEEDIILKFNDRIYPFLLVLIFFIDTMYFAFGYAVESSALGNNVKSVEPTFLGWFAALASYPPFNSVAGQFFQWGANDYAYFGSAYATLFVRLFVLFILLVYLSATLALGAKSSNLTNRGIVSRWPYRHIRHPAYASKVISWWILSVPVMSTGVFAGMAFWTVIYYLRAWTEERHLSTDPDYVEYKNKVRYMFVPGII